METLYFQSLGLILVGMSLLWIVSVFLKNVSIVDLFWGLGFVLVNAFFFFSTATYYPRQILLFVLVTIWGVRLTVYLIIRNTGKGEDFRYREFRRKYTDKRYWWISFFQTFMLQGILMWIISSALAGGNRSVDEGLRSLNVVDLLGLVVWIVGFFFEVVGDYQLMVFKKDPLNKGKVLQTGLWRYTRHPNYFGDAALWWGYGLICVASGSYLYALGAVVMTLLIIKVSGVALLEKSLKDKKPQYLEYIGKTSAFLPWFPKKE